MYANGAGGGGLGSDDPNIAMLEKAVPGVPGEDYPIYSEVPETAFTCDVGVEGGGDNASLSSLGPQFAALARILDFHSTSF